MSHNWNDLQFKSILQAERWTSIVSVSILFIVTIPLPSLLLPSSWVSVKLGLWTGLDWTMDGIGLDWPKQLYTDSERHQGYNSLSPALPQVASLLLSPRGIIFSISERSKVTCIFNKFQQGGSSCSVCLFLPYHPHPSLSSLLTMYGMQSWKDVHSCWDLNLYIDRYCITASKL